MVLWRQWAHRPGANRDMEMGAFFRSLESDHPEVLRFRFHGPKWELVRIWLKRDDKIRRSVRRAAES